MIAQTDRAIRAMTDDGAFRVMTVRTTDTVRAIAEAQRVTGRAATVLGEVVTGAVLVRETMAPGNRVEVLLEDRHGSRFVGDAHPEGRTRGLAQMSDGATAVELGGSSRLQVVRVVRPGYQQQGVVDTADGADVATALMRYFQQSEQIVTMVALESVEREDTLVASAGFVVQLLPELTEPPLEVMTERLRAFGALGPRIIASDADPERLLADLLDGFAHTRLHAEDVRFACTCGLERAMGAVSTLDRAELCEMLEAGDSVPVTCEFCRTVYRIGPDEIREILERTGR